VTRVAFATALACFALSALLAAMAWRRLGVVRLLLRTRGSSPDSAGAGLRKLEGTLEPAGAVVIAPFTERPVVYVRALLRGVGPEGGTVRVLWEKVLVAPARLRGRRGAVAVDLTRAQVLVPLEYRQGALRALVRDVKLVPRVLARAGYTSPPPASQFFELEEEVLVPGEPVAVLGQCDGAGTIAPGAGTPLLVSNLTAWRIALRLAWGPALALLFALMIALTGLGVLGTWWWLK
jgi:hypothetical protein